MFREQLLSTQKPQMQVSLARRGAKKWYATDAWKKSRVGVSLKARTDVINKIRRIWVETGAGVRVAGRGRRRKRRRGRGGGHTYPEENKNEICEESLVITLCCCWAGLDGKNGCSSLMAAKAALFHHKTVTLALQLWAVIGHHFLPCSEANVIPAQQQTLLGWQGPWVFYWLPGPRVFSLVAWPSILWVDHVKIFSGPVHTRSWSV